MNAKWRLTCPVCGFYRMHAGQIMCTACDESVRKLLPGPVSMQSLLTLVPEWAANRARRVLLMRKWQRSA